MIDDELIAGSYHIGFHPFFHKLLHPDQALKQQAEQQH